LQTISAAAELLERLSPTEQQAKLIRRLRSSSSALLGLANQILDYSRLEAGQTLLSEAPFDLVSLVRDTVDGFVARAEEKGLVLRCDIGSEVPAHVSGDSLKIQQ